jgi:hypothetical protein
MKAFKARFENGKVTLNEPVPDSGPVDVLVVFPETVEDPWQTVVHDAPPRTDLSKTAERARLDSAAKPPSKPNAD